MHSTGTVNKYRVYSQTNGAFVSQTFDSREALIAFMGEPTGEHKHKLTRAELQGQPKFKGWCGPMFDGDAIRYESKAAYDSLCQ